MLVSYIKTKKQITVTGRKRILAIGTETRQLGIGSGDYVIAYLVRPEDEYEFDTLLQNRGKQYYISFSERTDIIIADTLAQAESIAKEQYPDTVVIGGIDSRADAIRYRDILLKEGVPKDRLQVRLEELICASTCSTHP